MKEKLRFIPPFVILVLVVFFFRQTIITHKLPIPADTIVGLYHPFRDLYQKEYPNGIPFKNSLITDPVRQQYPWRYLSVLEEKKLEIPLWNPYSLSGTPLLGNVQSAALYPLNLLFFIFPFSFSWSAIIFLEPLLSCIFLYLYLKNLHLHGFGCILGAFVYGFCGFSVAWMEWGTILHVSLWLPLILLSIDKMLRINSSALKNRKLLVWSAVFIFSLVSSFFAGHLQTFFYVYMISLGYFFAKLLQRNKRWGSLFIFLLCNVTFFMVTSIQWIPTIQFLLQSGRSIDQQNWHAAGWFIPWQNLIQFIAPDFFGNPTTLNYWGVWNYGEFIGYVGILPLVFSLFAVFFRREKKTLFFGSLFFLSLIFSLPTFFAKIPYIFDIPFFSTAQPTRLLFVTDFSLSVLTGLGFDLFFKQKKNIYYPLLFIGLALLSFWIYVIFSIKLGGANTANLLVAKRNLFLPTVIFGINVLIITSYILLKAKKTYVFLSILMLFLLVFDLFHFGEKFLSFTNVNYLYPQTKTILFLQNQKKPFRIMSADSRELPPNFSIMYKLESIEGYDPIYLLRYGELIIASERNNPNISSPFGFNRIITPHFVESPIIDLLGVKYILSLSDLHSKKLKKVFQEGQTRIYENKQALPRAFFVQQLIPAINKQDAIESMYKKDLSMKSDAVVENFPSENKLLYSVGEVKMLSYLENSITLLTKNSSEGYLVLTDSFYSTWHVAIDNTPTIIYRTDYNFRGVIVPAGEHIIKFQNQLL